MHTLFFTRKGFRASLAIFTLSLLLAVPSTACMVSKSASTGATNDGGTLSYSSKRQTFQVREREVTGSTDHYNASGEFVGSSENSREVTKTKQGRRMTFFYQGPREIGEADYYDFGGDEEGARLANEMQSKLWWQNGASLGMVGVGAAGMLATAGGVFGDAGTGGYSLGYLGSGLVFLGGSYLFRHVMNERDAARLPLDRAAVIQVQTRR